jgi:prephenate dehydratase
MGNPLRVTYLGPPGTFSEDALRAAVGEEKVEAAPSASVYDAIVALRDGRADRALVPFENSIEGAVTATLDTLAFDADGLTLVGEYDLPIRHCLIAREQIPLEQIEVVLSHPQASAQCARFIRESLPQAEVRAAPSTAEAVRSVVESDRLWAALGAESAAQLYGAAVLRAGVEDEADNITRFVWVAREGTEPEGPGPWRTSLVFSELGEDHPGALVDALQVFSRREINLTRIESRPLRRGLGRYQFFLDIEGASAEEPLASAIEDLRSKAETVRVLGSWPTAAPPGVPGVNRRPRAG